MNEQQDTSRQDTSRQDTSRQDTSRLIFLSTSFKGVVLPLVDENKDKLTLGRHSTNDYQVEHDTVSGTHCSIIRDDDGNLRIHDMDSTNGTTLNGSMVPSGGIPLNCGDVIRIGVIEFLYDDEKTSLKLKTNSKVVVNLDDSHSLAINENTNLDPFYKPKLINKYVEKGITAILAVLFVITAITVWLVCLSLV